MALTSVGRELNAAELKTLFGLSTKQLKDARDGGMEYRQRDSGAYVYNSSTVFSFFTDRDETLESLESDVSRAKLRLTDLQADKIVIANARAARELAPISLMTEVMSSALSSIVFILEAIPMRVKSIYPDIDGDIIKTLEVEIAGAMDECARIEFPSFNEGEMGSIIDTSNEGAIDE